MKLIRRVHILLIFTLLCCMPETDAYGEPRIKVGISAPLTGEGATFGTDLKNVIQFANRELANNLYDIVVEDDHCDGKGAVTVAHKLVNVEKVSAAFFACDTAALVAAPIYRSKHVLVLTPLVTSPRYSNLGDSFFRLAPNDADNARILVSYIKRNHQRLGILTEGASEYCEDLGIEIEKAARSSGLDVVHERFGQGTSDFKTILLRLKSKGIDSLLINPTSEGPFLVALRQIRQLQLKFPLYGSYTPGSSTFRREAGQLAEGIVYTDFPALPPLDDTAHELFEKFKREFGPLNTWDFVFATGFESFRVMHESLQAGGDPSSFIHSNTFSGLLGNYRFDGKGDLIGISNDLRRISGGKAVLINTPSKEDNKSGKRSATAPAS
jgi:branched-chain amino acid transport system substrate-binding protein